MDINDCIPTFTMPSYNAQVLENLPAGVVVTMATAQDCDSGDNAVIRYSIVAGDISVFQVDGELHQRRHFDSNLKLIVFI